MLITVILFRSQSIVNVVGKIRLSEQQITLEGNHGVCNLEGTQHKWYDLMQLLMVFQCHKTCISRRALLNAFSNQTRGWYSI